MFFFFFPFNSKAWEHQSYRENMMCRWWASVLIFELRHVLVFVCCCYSSDSYHRHFSSGSCRQARGRLCSSATLTSLCPCCWPDLSCLETGRKVSWEKNIVLHEGLQVTSQTAPLCGEPMHESLPLWVILWFLYIHAYHHLSFICF